MGLDPSIEFLIELRGDALRAKQATWEEFFQIERRLGMEDRKKLRLIHEIKDIDAELYTIGRRWDSSGASTTQEPLRSVDELLAERASLEAELRRIRASYARLEARYAERRTAHWKVLENPAYDLVLRGSEKSAWSSALHQVARMAGVPEQHLDCYEAKEGIDGCFHFFFGGKRPPVGERHAHYIVNILTQQVTHKREPYARKGRRNDVSIPLMQFA